MKLRWSVLIPAFLIVACATAQQTSPTVNQLINNYTEAVGGLDNFSAVQSWSVRSDIIGDFRTVIDLGSTRIPIVPKKHYTFESYYKAPNLRIALVRTDQNTAALMYGCDGTVYWVYTPSLGFIDHKPKPGDGECDPGFMPLPVRLQRQNAKMELKGQKDIDGRRVFKVKVTPMRPLPGIGLTLYFDADNHLLVGVERVAYQSHSMELYSDYREINSLKIPFQEIVYGEYGETSNKILEVKVNARISDGIFVKPKLR